MNWIATHLVSACLLPPLNLILLAGFGLLLARSRPRAGRGLIALSLFLLYLMSTPILSDLALRKFEGPYVAPAAGADAIVVLGGGSYFDAPEYGGKNTVSCWALERLRYAARLYRKTGKPLLVTGGILPGSADSEASQMKAALEEDFDVPVKWTENASFDTEQNASKSAAILKRNGVRSIYLVSQAWHMPRAVRMFRRAGLTVIPAPTGFTTFLKPDMLSFFPSAEALWKNKILMHEIIGIAWFELKSQDRP